MQITKDIQSALNNLKYYNSRIAELAKQQFQLDCDRAQVTGINTGPGSIRFDSLAATIATCGWIDSYCHNIATNINNAIKQDKLLFTEEELEEQKYE